jgi:hypothetical protein
VLRRRWPMRLHERPNPAGLLVVALAPDDCWPGRDGHVVVGPEPGSAPLTLVLNLCH